MATAELAVALPTVTLFVVFGAGLFGALRDDLRCQDAARRASRAAAQGESFDVVRAVAKDAAPAGAAITVTQNGKVIAVSVSTKVGVPGPWSSEGPRWTIGAEAFAAAEPAA